MGLSILQPWVRTWCIGWDIESPEGVSLSFLIKSPLKTVLL